MMSHSYMKTTSKSMQVDPQLFEYHKKCLHSARVSSLLHVKSIQNVPRLYEYRVKMHAHCPTAIHVKCPSLFASAHKNAYKMSNRNPNTAWRRMQVVPQLHESQLKINANCPSLFTPGRKNVYKVSDSCGNSMQVVPQLYKCHVKEHAMCPSLFAPARKNPY